MKIRELVKPTDWRDKTTAIVAPVQIPIRLVRPKDRSASPDIFSHVDPNERMTADHAPDVNQLPTKFASNSMPHAPDLDSIKAQIAQLPRHAGR